VSFKNCIDQPTGVSPGFQSQPVEHLVVRTKFIIASPSFELLNETFLGTFNPGVLR